jgi:hypothetical protein
MMTVFTIGRRRKWISILIDFGKQEMNSATQLMGMIERRRSRNVDVPPQA